MFSNLTRRSQTLIGDATAYGKWLSSFSRTKSGISVTEATALNHSAVWACSDFISSTFAMLPVHMYQKEEGSKANSAIRISDERANLVSLAPNERQTAFRFKQLQLAQAVLRGNSYSWIERDERYRPVALWPLPAATYPHIKDGTLIYRTKLMKQAVNIPGLDVLHITGFGIDDDGLKGLSFVRYAQEVIGLGLAAQQFGASFFGQGANPRLVVTHPEEIGEEAQMRLANQLDRLYGGLTQAHKAAVLDEGMTFEKLSNTNEESQFMQTRKDNRIEIAGMMRVPPQMIGLWERSTFSNAEHMDIFVVKYTLNSWIVRWEQEFNFKLLSRDERSKGMYMKVNSNAILRGDMKARTEFYKTLMQGVLTGNEIRGLEDFPSLPGLDEPFRPLNMEPVGASDEENLEDKDNEEN